MQLLAVNVGAPGRPPHQCNVATLPIICCLKGAMVFKVPLKVAAEVLHYAHRTFIEHACCCKTYFCG